MNNNIAVVAGTGSYNDLGMIRSLGEAKIPVIYLTNGNHVIPIHKSKYIKETIICNFNEEGIVNSILNITKKHNCNAVLFPTSDSAALIFDEKNKELQDTCIAPHANGNLRKLMDKGVMAELAVKCGINTPKSIRIQPYVNEIIDYNNISTPCIVKPLRSVSGEKADITVCYSEEELNSCLNSFAAKQVEVIIQDYIEKPNLKEICITGVSAADKDIFIAGQINKYRIIGNGSTCYGQYTPEIDETLKEKVRKYISATRFTGIFDIEFLIDEEGQEHFIECNFRNGAYGYATTRGGFNLPSFFFHAMTTNGEIEVPSNLHAVVFMEERSDILNVKQKRISLSQWLKDVCKTDVFLFSNRKDIGPMIRVPHFIKHLLRVK